MIIDTKEYEIEYTKGTKTAAGHTKYLADLNFGTRNKILEVLRDEKYNYIEAMVFRMGLIFDENVHLPDLETIFHLFKLII